MTVEIKTVGIIGAGQMGNGIAHVAALAGHDVLLNDVSAETDQCRARDNQRQHGPAGEQGPDHRRRTARRP